MAIVNKRIFFQAWLLSFCLLGLLLVTASLSWASDPAKTIGPNQCAECHKDEAAHWQNSHHFTTFREMPRKKEANEIAKKVGVKRIRSDSLCLGCHYTVIEENNRPKPVAGISCESCHSGGKDWIKLHSEYSGKKKDTETQEEAANRWQQAEAQGMIRPKTIYRIAQNCFSCHVVPQEQLVNVGGHPAGSAFELVAWSQGEVRHNTWYSKGENEEASIERKRILFVVGAAVELETALRAVGVATQKQTYAVQMAKRASIARKKVTAMARLVPQVQELAAIANTGNAVSLKLNNNAELSAAADKIQQLIVALVAKHDGKSFASLDKYVPGPDKYKGQPKK